MGFMWAIYRVAMTISGSESPSFVPGEPDRSLTCERALAEIGLRLLDDAYSRWLVAESEAAEQLQTWLGAGGRSRQDSYCAYVAALDREHAAAHDLQRLLEIAASPPSDREEIALAPPA